MYLLCVFSQSLAKRRLGFLGVIDGLGSSGGGGQYEAAGSVLKRRGESEADVDDHDGPTVFLKSEGCATERVRDSERDFQPTYEGALKWKSHEMTNANTMQAKRKFKNFCPLQQLRASEVEAEEAVPVAAFVLPAPFVSFACSSDDSVSFGPTTLRAIELQISQVLEKQLRNATPFSKSTEQSESAADEARRESTVSAISDSDAQAKLQSSPSAVE
nr:hypothetical protein BHM03_00053129 [Ipomoea batatas]